MFFYEILLDLMDRGSLSIPDVARLTGLHDSTIRSIISRKSKSVALDVAAKISKGLNVDIAVLNGGEINNHDIAMLKESFIFSQGEQRHIKKYRALDGHGKRTVDFILDSEYERTQQVKMWEMSQSHPHCEDVVSMRVYWESAAAGFGNYLSDGDNFETREFPASAIPQKADFGIQISGDSMIPNILDGDIVWVEATPEIRDGEVGIFVLNGESFCKVLQISSKRSGKMVSLVSHNDAYPAIIIKEHDVLKTVGRVLTI